MIEFHLDGRSGVSPYQQLVQQVRNALRLDLLREGDQLPTVKDVVGSLAINPNTVLKAYRELEHEGLVAARPGVGTFVTRTPGRRVARGARSAPPRPPALADQGAPCRAGRGEHRGVVQHHLSWCLPGGHSVSTVLRADGLGKKYRRRWALSDCTLDVPAGKVVGLVGPNGAGKTTLLNLAVGLRTPTTGTIEVLGGRPADGPDQLARVGFVAQDTPTYAGLTVDEHLRLGAHLNPRWDDAVARDRIDRIGVDPGQRAGRLSGGQRAQLALTLGIAKRPELLILDEPVASLDPLARREFLQDLMEAVAEHELSVVLSSHLVSDLERVCDHLIVLVDSRVQVAGDIDALLATHHRLTGARRDPETLPADQHVISSSHTDRQTSLLVRTEAPILDPTWIVSALSLEDLVLAYMSGSKTVDRDRRAALEVLR